MAEKSKNVSYITMHTNLTARRACGNIRFNKHLYCLAVQAGFYI